MLTEVVFKKIRNFGVGFIVILCVVSFITVSPVESDPYVYKVPEKLDDGWETATLHDSKVDRQQIIKLICNIRKINSNGDPKTKIDAVLLVKEGKLILEEYFNGYGPDELHGIYSVTKSIGSVLTGIVIDKGFIENVDEKIYPHLKTRWPEVIWDEREKNVTIENLLTMTSGYECDDHLTDFDCQTKMRETPDWVKYTLDLPMIRQPGKHWAYNSSTPMLIAEVIKAKTGISIQDFAETNLFQIIGVKNGIDFRWEELESQYENEYNDKRVSFAGGASMKPRAMAKFGYIMLNNGKWKNKQIVSQTWINKSTSAYETTSNNFKYGYMWWRGQTEVNIVENNVVKSKIIEAFWAAGHNGQRIFILPELDLVAVFTGNLKTPRGLLTHGMMINYIIPASQPNISSRQSIHLPSSMSQKYAGKYIFKKNTKMEQEITIESEGNKLVIRSDKWEKFEIFPEAENRFFGTSSQLGNILINFTFSPNGEVALMTVDFAFTSWECKKL